MNTLSKKLQSRHVNMIALGGSIGTGIFLASGYAVSVAGPGGALLAYALMALIVYCLMTSLGEMSAFKPTSGSFCDYSLVYVDPSFGIAMGYNYWLNWAITIAAEISAAALVMSYWFPTMHSAWFSFAFFALILLSNLYSVRVFGEVEYTLSFVKVAVIILFIVLGLTTIVHQPQFGIGHWQIGDAPFHQGWYGFIAVFLFAGFSFQGTELVGVASGETENASVAIPKSIKLVFWRLTLFYVLSMIVIGLLIPYNDPRLSSQNSVNISPYTLIFSHYISNYAADIVNVVILVALLSAANASMYSSTRILWYLGHTKQAPSVFETLNRRQVPLFALLVTALIGSLVFLSSFIGNGVLFTYLVQISSLSGFLAWFGIALSHYRFRKYHLPRLGGLSSLPYRAKFYPYAQLLSLFVITLIITAQWIPMALTYHQSWIEIITTYTSVLIFLLTYVGHRMIRAFRAKTRSQ